MEKMINKPLAGTFRWLRMGAAKVELKEEPKEKTIEVKEGQKETLVIDNEDALLSIKAILSKDASLDLIQISEANEDDLKVADIRVSCKDNASFHWYRLVLGGEKTYDNCSVSLEGKDSSFSADIAYSLDNEELYDVNCEAIHTGKNTSSDIKTSGVLDGNAKKIMRGTIDFRKGSSASVGNEMEDVLLLSSKVHNQSLPVILCAEEDVEGNHGATIGRPDEKILYYMGSRGIDEKEAIGLLADAKLFAVINKIPSEVLKEALMKRIGKKHGI